MSKGEVLEYDEGNRAASENSSSSIPGAVSLAWRSTIGSSNEVCKLNEVAEFYSDHEILFTKNVVDSL